MDPTSLDFYVKRTPIRELTDNKTGEPSGVCVVFARLAFASFAKPKKDDRGKENYTGALIIPAALDISPLRAAAGRLFAAEFGADWKTKLEKGMIKSPFKLQSTMAAKNYDGFGEDGYFINVKRSATIDPVTFFSASMDPLPIDQIYSGMWAVCKVRPYGYKATGNQGVSFGINVIQKVCDDEEFKGGNAAEGLDAIEHHNPAAVNGAAKSAPIANQESW